MDDVLNEVARIEPPPICDKINCICEAGKIVVQLNKQVCKRSLKWRKDIMMNYSDDYKKACNDALCLEIKNLLSY